MGLRRKTLLIIGATAVALFALLYFAANAILLGSYTDLENQRSREDLWRVFNALNNELSLLQIRNLDWAAWDDTYVFVTDHNEAYIDANLVDGTFSDQQLNMMLFYNAVGDLVYGKAYDLVTDTAVAIPANITDFFAENPAIIADVVANGATNDHGRGGLVALPDNVLLVSILPILTSDNAGPTHGALIWGRYLDAAITTNMAHITRLDLSIERYDAANLPEDFVQARATLRPDQRMMTHTLDHDHAAGYGLVMDILGAPLLILRIVMERDIVQQGHDTIRFFMLALGAVSIGIAGAALVLLERVVLARMLRLSQAVRRIRATNDLATRVDAHGSDELAALAQDINGMLGGLAESRAKLQQAHDELELHVAERTAELQTTNDRLREEVALHMKTQAELAQARDQALEALRLKAQILANMSHSARTPLSVITLRTNLMRKERYGILSDKQRSALDSIDASSTQLLAFFDSLLDESRIVSGTLKLQNRRFEPSRLLVEIINILHPEAQKAGLTLVGEITPDMPETLRGDTARIKQMLINLGTNAIKFTEAGLVTVRMYRVDSEHWALSVKDTGAGIAEGVQERIFDTFWQVDGSPTRTSNTGVGLGLSIVRQLATLMGGQIQVQSVPGTGSTFCVTLPIEPPYGERIDD